MELIPTRVNADFAAAASMLAASRLCLQTRLACPGSLERAVREDVARRGAPFPPERLRTLDLAAVSRLILGDRKWAGRFGPLKALLAAPGLEAPISDRHQPTPRTSPAPWRSSKRSGRPFRPSWRCVGGGRCR